MRTETSWVLSSYLFFVVVCVYVISGMETGEQTYHIVFTFVNVFCLCNICVIFVVSADAKVSLVVTFIINAQKPFNRVAFECFVWGSFQFRIIIYKLNTKLHFNFVSFFIVICFCFVFFNKDRLSCVLSLTDRTDLLRIRMSKYVSMYGFLSGQNKLQVTHNRKQCIKIK